MPEIVLPLVIVIVPALLKPSVLRSPYQPFFPALTSASESAALMSVARVA